MLRCATLRAYAARMRCARRTGRDGARGTVLRGNLVAEGGIIVPAEGAAVAIPTVSVRACRGLSRVRCADGARRP